MSSFELNKIFASLLLAALICMVSGNLADLFYHKNSPSKERGFAVNVQNAVSNDAAQKATSEPPIDIAALMSKANAQLGKDMVKKCIACHNVNEGEPNKIGPHLWDVVGRDKAIISDYNYSKAMKSVGGKWDYESLFAYLKNPAKFIPGNKMAFAGIAKSEDIANLVAFLRSQSHNPLPLP